MSYTEYEKSEYQSFVIELYKFEKNGVSYNFTSAESDYAFPGEGIFKSVGLKRSSISQGAESSKNGLTITAPLGFEIGDQFKYIPTAGVMIVTVFRLQIEDELFDRKAIWSGKVLGAKWVEDSLSFNCEPLTISFKRNGLRRLYSKDCSHVLYSPACGVPRLSVENIIETNAGLKMRMTYEMEPNHYAGGYLQTQDGKQQVMIIANNSYELTLIYPIKIPVGEIVDIFKGCDLSTTTCRGRYNNLDNFGGFPFMPDKNPFDTGVF